MYRLPIFHTDETSMKSGLKIIFMSLETVQEIKDLRRSDTLKLAMLQESITSSIVDIYHFVSAWSIFLKPAHITRWILT